MFTLRDSLCLQGGRSLFDSFVPEQSVRYKAAYVQGTADLRTAAI